MKVNIKNERIKRGFFRYLKEANRCCKSTINSIEKAILLYEDFTKHADFNTFNSDKAVAFKDWLKAKKYREKLISVNTYFAYLRSLRKFFTWVSWQSGYKSRITPNIIAYLSTTTKEEKMATQSPPRNYPSQEYVINLTDSIKINSEIDQRDRALIAFAFLTGMRDKAVVTLPLGCFDEEKLTISQNPKLGVDTKFSKYINSVVFKFNKKLVDYVIDWVKFLKVKGFGAKDPMFPRSKLEQNKDGLSYQKATKVEPKFWSTTGRIREIFKARSRVAGLPYYSPNTYRHLAIDLAIKHCRGGEQIKAVSQTFGHEHITTTLSVYGNFNSDRLSNVLGKIDFSEESDNSEKQIEKIREIINSGY